jgi:hypothetical protein
VPKSVTQEAFASIFRPRTRANKVSDIISTLSRTVDELDTPMAKMTISNKHEGEAGWDSVQKIDVKYTDGTESSTYVQLNSMSGQFLPFRPPPTPEPQTVAQAEAEAAEIEAAADESAEEASPQHRVYRAMFTIEETTDPDGQVRVMAHSPQILQNDQPRTFLQRMALRHLRFEDAQRRDGETMEAISVKRQRKLKMKKKKYKKFMKRTRTLRRKLDRV